jgi:hypothetical protein
VGALARRAGAAARAVWRGVPVRGARGRERDAQAGRRRRVRRDARVGAESLLAFGGSALALEYACSRGWLSKLAGELPSEEDDAADAPALSDAELAEKERKREALSAKRSWDMKMRWREKKAAENPDE